MTLERRLKEVTFLGEVEPHQALHARFGGPAKA